jgi:hypothetical protein
MVEGEIKERRQGRRESKDEHFRREAICNMSEEKLWVGT